MYRKYKAKKTEVDGIVFDSKKEAARYQELKLLEKAGAIKDLRLQPNFLLQDKFQYQGKTERKIEYIADFQYYVVNENKWVIEDVKSKGTKTQVYNIKRKLFLKKYGEKYEFFENID